MQQHLGNVERNLRLNPRVPDLAVEVISPNDVFKDVLAKAGVKVGNDVVIGDNVRIQNNVSVYDAVTLEDEVFCGPSMVFTNVYNPRAAVARKKIGRASCRERV